MTDKDEIGDLVGADLTILRKEPTGRRVMFRGAGMLTPLEPG